ncbi:hypothetical protein [Streptosporangium amethystogenes]|uniref:hypothetical protein n=1 Tax=Streptosporangium amethystogenes TaxID=2002 RepID=UPI001B80AD7B|nr:hypothetical protein [Streptosporangium amethystogenes]
MTAKSQIPLRFCQSGRVSCGQGYSGRGLFTGTCEVQGVLSGGVFGVQAAAAALVTVTAEAGRSGRPAGRRISRAVTRTVAHRGKAYRDKEGMVAGDTATPRGVSRAPWEIGGPVRGG